MIKLFCVWFFLFGVFRYSRVFFHLFENVTIAGEGLQMLNNARLSWPLSSECSLECLTYRDTEHPFIMGITDDSWHSHLLSSVWQSSCHCFNDLSLSRLGFEHPTFRLWDERSNLVHHRRGLFCVFSTQMDL